MTWLRLLSVLNTDPFHTGEGKQLRLKHLEALKNANNPNGGNAPKIRKKHLQLVMEDVPVRVFSIAWLLFCFFFVTYLSAEIQSKATVSRLERRIGSLQDLVDVSLQRSSTAGSWQNRSDGTGYLLSILIGDCHHKLHDQFFFHLSRIKI